MSRNKMRKGNAYPPMSGTEVDGGGKVSSGKTSGKVEVKDPEKEGTWQSKIMKGIGDAGKAVGGGDKQHAEASSMDSDDAAIMETGKAIGGMIEESGRRKKASASSSGGGKGGTY